MSDVVPTGANADGGNTTPHQRESCCYRFVFTWFPNQDGSKIPDLLNWITIYCKKSVVGEETCPTTNKTHLQGFFHLKTKQRWSVLSKKLQESFKGLHLEKQKGSDKQNIDYCSKEGKILLEIPKKKIIKSPLEGKELYKWQSKVLKLIEEEPDDRKVYWFWDKKGKTGKSALVKHIYLKYPNEVVIANGKGNDVRNQINNHLNIENKENIKVAILDCSRTVENFVSYEVIEQIKNGLLYSGKYEGGVCCFDSPHVLVFANFEPDYDALSKDRWKVVNIDTVI